MVVPFIAVIRTAGPIWNGAQLPHHGMVGAGSYLIMCACIATLSCGCCCSPALVANLWDVTDGDIDRYCKTLLQEWLLAEESQELASTACSARSSCKLPFLVGASPVVYGLPVHTCPHSIAH